MPARKNLVPRAQMNDATPSLLSSGGTQAANVLPPLQWGWLALVAGLHAAGLAWLGLADAPQAPTQHPHVLSVTLLDAPQAAPPASAPEVASPVQAPVEPRPVAQRPEPPKPRPPQPSRRVASAPASGPSAPSRQPIVPLPPAHTAPTPVQEPRLPGETGPTPPPAAEPPPTVVLASAMTGASGQSDALTPARYDADYLHNPTPEYPAAARRRGEEGRVMLRVRVLASGRPADIEVVESSTHPRLDRAARAAVASWRFEPARQGGQAVDSWLRVPIVFRLEGG